MLKLASENRGGLKPRGDIITASHFFANFVKFRGSWQLTKTQKQMTWKKNKNSHPRPGGKKIWLSPVEMVIIQPDSTLLCGSDLAAGFLCPQGTSALLPPSQLKTGDFPTSCDEMQMGLIPYLVGGFNHLEKCLKPPTSSLFLWERKEKHFIPCLTTYVFFFYQDVVIWMRV